MRKMIAVTALGLGLFLCSSRGTDLFHITAEEQMAKFQDLFRGLVSEDKKSLSRIIASFVLGNDPDGTNQVALYDHDSFIDFLTAPSSNYDHISVTVYEASLTTKTEFRDGKPLHSDGDDQKEIALYNPYIVVDSEIVYECNMTDKGTGARRKARVRVSMDNVYTDEYPEGIITYLYFTDLDQQDGNINPVSRSMPSTGQSR